MASFDERLEQRTQVGIDQAIEDTLLTLAAGQLPSYADYRYYCGVIAGLRRTKDFLAQALTDIQKG